MAHGHNPAKVPKSNIKYDGIPSIGNFMLMINNHFKLFQLPGNLSKTKKCAAYFRGNTQFPIYSYFRCSVNSLNTTPGTTRNRFWL
jgi:hypothetical protein